MQIQRLPQKHLRQQINPGYRYIRHQKSKSIIAPPISITVHHKARKRLCNPASWSNHLFNTLLIGQNPLFSYRSIFQKMKSEMRALRLRNHSGKTGEEWMDIRDIFLTQMDTHGKWHMLLSWDYQRIIAYCQKQNQKLNYLIFCENIKRKRYPVEMRAFWNLVFRGVSLFLSRIQYS